MKWCQFEQLKNQTQKSQQLQTTWIISTGFLQVRFARDENKIWHYVNAMQFYKTRIRTVAHNRKLSSKFFEELYFIIICAVLEEEALYWYLQRSKNLFAQERLGRVEWAHQKVYYLKWSWQIVISLYEKSFNMNSSDGLMNYWRDLMWWNCIRSSRKIWISLVSLWERFHGTRNIFLMLKITYIWQETTIKYWLIIWSSVCKIIGLSPFWKTFEWENKAVCWTLLAHF